MKRSFLFFFLLLVVTTSAQPGRSTQKERFPNADSIRMKIVKVKDSLDAANRTADSIHPIVIDEKNIVALVQTQDKLNKRKKQGAIIRIAIGIFFLVVLMIGLMRRKKVRSQQPTINSKQ